MLLAVILSVSALSLSLILGYLAYHATLHPPQDEKDKKKLKLKFIILSASAIVVSATQVYRNYQDQENAKNQLAAYELAVHTGNREMRQFFGNKCLDSNAFERLTERCFSEVRGALAKLIHPQSQLIATMKRPSGKPDEGTSTAAETPAEQSDRARITNPQPAKTSTPNNSTLPDMAMETVIHFGDGPRCFDVYARPVFEGCADATCSVACITLPADDERKNNGTDQKPKQE